jgi:hypothetical protein
MSSREQLPPNSSQTQEDLVVKKKRPLPEPYNKFSRDEFGKEIVFMRRAEWVLRDVAKEPGLSVQERGARLESFYAKFPESREFLDTDNEKLGGKKPLHALREKIEAEKVRRELRQREKARKSEMRKRQKRGEKPQKVTTPEAKVKATPSQKPLRRM